MLKFIIMGIGLYILIIGPFPQVFQFSNQVLGLTLMIVGPVIAHFLAKR